MWIFFICTKILITSYILYFNLFKFIFCVIMLIWFWPFIIIKLYCVDDGIFCFCAHTRTYTHVLSKFIFAYISIIYIYVQQYYLVLRAPQLVFYLQCHIYIILKLYYRIIVLRKIKICLIVMLHFEHVTQTLA